jgi:hypothetical protein
MVKQFGVHEVEMVNFTPSPSIIFRTLPNRTFEPGANAL